MDRIDYGSRSKVHKVDLSDGCETLYPLRTVWGTRPPFEGCPLELLVLPSRLTIIGDSLFSDSGLISVDLTATAIEKLERDAFGGCRRLRELAVPATLKSIGCKCFSDTALETVRLDHCRRLEQVGAGAFSGCEKLRELVLPFTAVRLGQGIWATCPRLVMVDYPAPIEEVNNPLDGWLGSPEYHTRFVRSRGAEVRLDVCGGTIRVEFAEAGTMALYSEGRPVIQARPLQPTS
jgi:hypothetical protein